MQISKLPALRLAIIIIPLILFWDNDNFIGVVIFSFFIILSGFLLWKSWRIPLILITLIGIVSLRMNLNMDSDFPEGVYEIKKITKSNNDRISFFASGQELVLFNVKKDQKVDFFIKGDLIFSNKYQKEVSIPKTLDGFNYKEYLHSHGIEKVVYAEINELTLIDRDSISLSFYAHKIKQGFIGQILSYEEVGLNARGVLIALITGDKSFLAKEDKSLFRNSGVVHVLAISGLHVGVFYVTLSFLFFKIFQFNDKIGLVAILILLVSYAFVTGLSPSVIRATIMFGLIQIGKSFNKEVSTLNIVLSTAILMLFWDPQLLYDIGFQLSFSAVIGIVLFVQHTILTNLISRKYLKPIWTFFVVNISAFLFTAPILSYHFGILNLTSLWASCLVVPLVSIAMYLALFAFATSFISSVSLLFVKAFGFLYDWILSVLMFIEAKFHLEFNVGLELLIVFSLFAIVIFIVARKVDFLIVAIIFALLSLSFPAKNKITVLSNGLHCELKVRKKVFRLNVDGQLFMDDVSFSLINENSLVIVSNKNADTLDFNVNKYHRFEIEN